ncbi:MAG: vWA domain-containing protein, partial [Planctomycetota bacterium]
MNTTVETPFDGISLGLAVVLLVVWGLVRFGIGRLSGSNAKWVLAPVSLLAAWGFWSSALQSLSSLIETASNWPLSVLALLAAVTCDVALTLYVDNRGAKPGIVHWAPIGLRLMLVSVLVFILMEPIVSHQEEKSDSRKVAVLLDGSASMDLSHSNTAADAATNSSRRGVARQLLLDAKPGDEPLLDRLQSDYDVRLYEFAANSSEVKLVDWRQKQEMQGNEPAHASTDWSKRTEIAEALYQVTDQLPLDELSGLILLTDGCDHSRRDLQDSVSGLARRQIPIHTVLIGDQSPISDAEVGTLQAPQQVFMGDSVAIRAPIKVDRLAGRNVNVRLLKDGQAIDEMTVEVRGNRHRETLVFRDQPDEIGVHQYAVELDPVPGESIPENNRASARVWVSKDYIRMLIVENRPRWEFRYLKNLFAGRDRSVQLQHVLLRPDRLAGVPDPPIMHASVNRSFDDCEATALPESEEEWMKFDVIVLGDVAPRDLGTGVMETLEKFTAKRGGSLIVVAGRQYMPHAFEQTPLADALPVQLAGSRPGDAASPDSSYYFKIASGAESHVIVQQSSYRSESEAVWQSLPQLHWRHPASRAKAGATVLAYAGLAPDAVGSARDQQDRALILWHRFGAGKVMQLTFDQTWRLRYGVGDKHHHQFWGQVLRWSIQDRLAAGTELVRLGTDRVLYRGGDSVTVRARLLDENRNTVVSQDTMASVYLNDELVQQTLLGAQSDSGGMLTATIDGLEKAGKYRVELSGPTVDQLLQSEGRAEELVSLDFAIEGLEENTEMSDKVADSSLPIQLADWSGGTVVSPAEAASLLDLLGPKSTFQREQWTVPLWNLWPVIASFLLIVSLEWTMRKSTGLI